MSISESILNARILIVDDQSANVTLLQYILEGAGYTNVSSTMDARTVVDLYQEYRYDAVLLDLKMPHMNGFQVMEALAGIETEGYLPILVLTAEPALKTKALQAGAKDFVSKPFDNTEVLTRIRNLLEVRLLHKSLRRYNASLEQQVEEKSSNLREAEGRIEYLSNFDSTTGLPNRHLLRDGIRLLQEQVAGGGGMIGFFMIDFTRLPLIRESLGAKAEHEILLEIANRLREWSRNEDYVARYGDSQFTVFGIRKQPRELSALARSLLQLLDQPFGHDGQELYLEAAIGIAVFPGDGQEFDILAQCAEVAMRRAAAGKTTRYEFYTPELNRGSRQRFRLESALRKALAANELVVHYQPKVCLRDGSVIGMEALVRWKHPELGLIPPGRFIGLAEETGLIVQIGEWVLRTACAEAKQWQDAGGRSLRIAVNVSARQFSHPGLVKTVSAALCDTVLAPECLELELTESMLMSDIEHAVRVLNELRALGVQLSIDDFGTGYSSLSYLKRFPIDVLKIDQSFVREITQQSNDAAISDAIISMAHSLGIKVIAEGVETEEQCAYLAGKMCDEIQGYLFARPLPADEMGALLREGRCLPQHLLRMHKPRRTLLLVDDEPNIIAALKRLVRRDGYQVFTAAGGKEGLEVLSQNTIDVIVSDQRMPGMTGVDFLRAVKTLYPDTVRIVLSGFTELQAVTDAVNEGAIYKFLTKPWDDGQLREHIAQAFEHKEMADENRRLNLEVRTANQELARANRQLEELLRQKQRQIRNREVSLDIVREALMHVPLPVIGLDDDGLVVLANVAAWRLFNDAGLILGVEASLQLPEIVEAVRGAQDGEERTVDLNGFRFGVAAYSMGKGTQSRGTLITLSPR